MSQKANHDTHQRNTIPLPDKIDDNNLKFEFETLLQEYRLVNDHVMHRLEAEEKSFELTGIAITAVVAASSLIITQKIYSLLLVLAVPFYVLIWEQFRRAINAHHLMKYIIETIAPRLNTIIQHTSIKYQELGKPIKFVSWESYVSSMLNRRTYVGFINSVPIIGKIILQISVSVALLLSYVFLQSSDAQYIVTAFDTYLLIINGLVFLISLIYIVFVPLYRYKIEKIDRPKLPKQ